MCPENVHAHREEKELENYLQTSGPGVDPGFFKGGGASIEILRCRRLVSCQSRAAGAPHGTGVLRYRGGGGVVVWILRLRLLSSGGI